MRIRITQGMPDGAQLNGVPWPAEGGEIDVLTTHGAHLVAAGVAEEVTDEPRPRDRKSRKGGGGE